MQKTVKTVMTYAVCVVILWGLAPAHVEAAKEREPNNTEDQAMVVPFGESVSGVFTDGRDYFRMTLPQPGRTTVTVSGFPPGVAVQVGVKGFTGTTWEDSDGASSVSLTFDAKNREGVVWVRVRFVQSVCGSNWCIARFIPRGTYHVTRPSDEMPPSYDGVSILPSLTYRLTATQGTASQPAVKTEEPSGAPVVKEVEPNNTEDAAMAVPRGCMVAGTITDGRDYYRVGLAGTGTTTVTVTGYPPGARVLVGVKGFTPTRWQESDGAGRVSLTFDATGLQGIVWVSVRFVESVCGSDWCIARLAAGGPYYVTKSSPSVPSSRDGAPVLPTAHYVLEIK